MKTDLVPQPGMTFEMGVRFDGPCNPMFGGKFDLERNTKAFFGEEDEEVDGVRNLYKLEFVGVTCPDGSVRSYACYDMTLYGATFYKDGKRIARFIRCLTRRRGGEWRIYTANINPHPNANVAFTLPTDIPQDARVEVMYENRSLQAKGGCFADSFDGFPRHIYRIVK